jgi:hypothetical protein
LERERSRWAKPLRRRVHGNVVEPESDVTVLFNIVDSYEQCAMWAVKHCSILFSSVLHQPERFYVCNSFYVIILLFLIARQIYLSRVLVLNGLKIK